MHQLPAFPRARRSDQVRGGRELTRPGPRALLLAIAEIESFDRTLDQFPDIDSEHIRSVLRDAAERLPKDERKKTSAAAYLAGEELHMWSDGASRGNPGPASVGVMIRTPDGIDVDTISLRLGRRTNNYAEYEAVRCALQRAVELGAKRVKLHADSELVIKQLRGIYRVKNETLRPLYEAVKKLERKLDRVDYQHVRREYNREADALANEALDN